MDRTKPSLWLSVIPQGRQDATRVDVTGRVLEFEYHDAENAADSAKLTLDNYDLAMLDDPLWRKGNVLEVSWGYPELMSPPRRMRIKSIKGFSKLTIEAFALSTLMHEATHCRCWEHSTRAAVVRELAQSWGYGPTEQHIEDTTQVFETISQAGMSDAAFVRRLAFLEGFAFYVDFDGFHWHPRNIGQPTHQTYTWFTSRGNGDKIIDEPKIDNDITDTPGAVVLRGRDPENKGDVNEGARELATPPAPPVPTLSQILQMPSGANAAANPSEPADSSDEYARRYNEWFYSTDRGTTMMSPPSADAILHGRDMPVPEVTHAPIGGSAQSSAPSTPGAVVPPRPTFARSLEARRDPTTGGIVYVWLDSESKVLVAGAPAVAVPVAVGTVAEATTAQDATAAATHAGAQQDQLQRTTVKLKFSVIGDPTLLAKTVVELRGIGRRHSGRYYVSEVVHRWSTKYICEIRAWSDGTQGYQDPALPEAVRDEGLVTPRPRPDPAVLTEAHYYTEDGRISMWVDSHGRESGERSTSPTSADWFREPMSINEPVSRE